MNVVDATRAYEAWVGAQVPLIAEDIAAKHQAMTASLFGFFRATYYRWIQSWPALCPDLAAAPEVLAVGDLHIENFGTWRDRDGRLVWGVNDFDEAWPAAYTLDLVRLIASGILAAHDGSTKRDDTAALAATVAKAVVTGYAEGLDKGGRAFVLEEHHAGLRALALDASRDPPEFWKKMTRLPVAGGDVPMNVRALMLDGFSESTLRPDWRRRRAGLGSLGRPRFVVLIDWHDSLIAREAKLLVASANRWAHPDSLPDGLKTGEIVARAVRCPDPLWRLADRWLIRRLAPHCSRIELTTLSGHHDRDLVLAAMGRETANIHLGNHETIGRVRADLAARHHDGLADAARRMVMAVAADWQDWKNFTDKTES